MRSLAAIWTAICCFCIPTALALIYADKFPGENWNENVQISFAHFYLVVSLVAANFATWVLAAYIKKAKQTYDSTWLPPFLKFEDRDRYPLISILAVTAFCLTFMLFVIIFGQRYSDSRIHQWDAPEPLAQGFFESRIAAHKTGCEIVRRVACFAIARRIEPDGSITRRVSEYVIYLHDSLLIAAAILLAIMLYRLARVVLLSPPPNYHNF